MPEVYLNIQGRDPLLFRDGRPFGTELGALNARSLPLPMPGTLAGFLRTRYGNRAGWSWDAATANRARSIRIAGPLLCRICEKAVERTVVLPAPADAVVIGADPMAVMPLRPEPGAEARCNLPGGLRPLRVSEDVKPAQGYFYWPWPLAMEWLEKADGAGQRVPPQDLRGPERDTRTHIKMDETLQTAEEGMLFSTESLAFGDEWSLQARLDASALSGDDVPLAGVATFGGERGLAYVDDDQPAWPKPPETLTEKLCGSKRVRLQLATPAVFDDGWKPGWLNENLCGAPPGAVGLNLRLVSAAVKRREPVSGWDLEFGGPKAVRWLVPAGSVFFFEVEEGSADALVKTWLQPVSDGEQQRNDGYGLALWGVWSDEKERKS